MGKKGAKVGSFDFRQRGRSDFFSTILPKESNQSMGGRGVGANGVRRTSAVVLKMRGPTGDERTRGMII
jgi:hypothetical protein